MNPPNHDPRSEYTRRLDGARLRIKGLARVDRVYSFLRFLVFAIAIVAGIYWLGSLRSESGERLAVWWLGVPAAFFFGLVALHARTVARLRRARRAEAFYDQGLARLDERWIGVGPAGDRYLTSDHLYGRDLDIFGQGSLFQLICTARSSGGQDALAGWLQRPAPPEIIRARQAAIDELRPMVDFREALAVIESKVYAGIDPEGLKRWGESPVVLVGRAPRILAFVLGATGLAAAIGWLFVGIGPGPLALVIAAEYAFTRFTRRDVDKVVADVLRHGRELGLLASLLRVMERQNFRSPLLAELSGALEAHGHAASARLAKLERMISLLEDGRNNPLFTPIALLLLWTTQLAYALDAWRMAEGASLGRWLDSLAEIEALCALSGYAYEHPADPFPEFVGGGPRFEGEGLAHPLLADCVRNDVILTPERRLLIVSGSNMAGKSTLLRTVGVNAALAQAGAPVRARKLRLSPLTIGASIQTIDSLREGRSRFFTEITRIRDIVRQSENGGSLLYLLDEVLHGTNSHDRRVGVEAIMRKLTERDAVGIITTHDLALTEIALDGSLGAENVHFADEIVKGEIVFDYKMRSGVVQKSNALELMRSVGLDL